jgi:hypothetical protein
MDAFDKRFFDSSGFLSAHMGDKGCTVYNDQAGGHCCLLNAGDWWIFCRTFLLLNLSRTKKVLIKIYCIEKSPLDLDPI